MNNKLKSHQEQISYRKGASLWRNGSQDWVGWVPVQDRSILQAEDGASGWADDSKVLCELGLDEALGVGTLSRRAG